MRLRAGPVTFGTFGTLLFLAVLPEILMFWLLIAAVVVLTAVVMAVSHRIKPPRAAGRHRLNTP